MKTQATYPQWSAEEALGSFEAVCSSTRPIANHPDPKSITDCQNTVREFIEQQKGNLELLPDLLAALKATREAMLRHAGWNQNFDASGKELPMTRPKDVQAADDLASAALLKAERTGEGR